MARIVGLSTSEVNTGIPGSWCKDYTGREHNLPGGIRLDPAEWGMNDEITVTVGAGGAAQGAVAVPVAALDAAIPSGTILDFTGAGKFALLTDDAAEGATSLTVEALPEALAEGDTATYEVEDSASNVVVSGTLIGRTYVERDAGTGFGPADVGADAANPNDDEIFLLLFDVSDVSTNPDAEAYRHGGLVAENYLPEWDGFTAAEKAWVRTHYQTTIGAP